MPHFGLMDESAMPSDEAALLRSRLHLRGGRRRMRQTKYAAAVAALYDALCSGMRWYILSTEKVSLVALKATLNHRTDRELFSALVQAGVLDDTVGFERLNALLDQALDGQTSDLDPEEVLPPIERWLTQVGVMPFNEAALPPEDPDTY